MEMVSEEVFFVCGVGIRGGGLSVEMVSEEVFFVCGVGIRGGGLSVEMVSEVGFLAVGEVQTEERGGDSRRGSTLLL